MNFLQQLKKDLSDYHSGHNKVTVDARALNDLIYHFERLDSYDRISHPNFDAQCIESRLRDVIHASYQSQDKNSEYTLTLIMKILLPLMEEKQSRAFRITRPLGGG